MRLDYQYFAALLKEEREKIKESLSPSNIGNKEDSLRESTQEISFVDNHPADTGSELFERSKDLSLNEKQVEKLQSIERSLKRISEGTYGVCASCGRDIDRNRLKTVPWVQYCVSCEKKLEDDVKKGEESQRPIEEPLLHPPFTSQAEQFSSYGPEEAWEDVAYYGTANSPQDDLHTYDTEESGHVDEMDKFSSGEKIKQVEKEDKEEESSGIPRKKRK